MAFFAFLIWLATGNGPVASVGSAAAADPAVGAGAWLAAEVRGTVVVRTAGEAARSWQPLQAATPIAGLSEIATGSDGVAVLDNGVDQIRLAPNSRLVLPPDENEGLLTVIQQSLGKIFFKVGPRPDRRFEVDAPYLVVLVKGTQFTITANDQGDSVAVTEGTVEVRTTAGGNAEGALISAGQTASVVAGGGSLTVDSAESGQTSQGDGSASGKGGSEPRSQLPPLPNGEPEPPGGGDESGGTVGGDDGHDGGDQGGDDGGDGDGGDGEGGGGDQGGNDGGDSDSGGDGDGGGGHGAGSGHGHSGERGD